MDMRDIKEFLKDAIKYLVVIVTVIFVVIYVVTLEQVVGPSMYPTFNEGDVVVLNKFVYRFKDVRRGEIISFKNSGSKYLIKRVIGLPGETVEIKDNKIYIDEKALNEYYLKNIDMEDFSLSDLGYDEIPQDMYFVLGDNRSNSQDSRDPKIGLIKKSDILGRVKYRIWPLNRIGAVR